MIIFRRLHLESPLSPEELRARLDAAIGLSGLHVFDPKWPGDIDTPFIGKMDGMSFKGMRRSRYRYAQLRGSIQGSAVDAEIGVPELYVVGLVLTIIIFFPIAIVNFFSARNDIRQLEARLREVVSATR
jgi:hypothetical protein